MKKGNLAGNAIDDSIMVSVIVPVYKVERYLDKCVESILNQTYKNLEIILIDDGSPDKCGEMCEIWAKKDRRIKVIHKENGGLSDARNAGIEICSGRYVGFVDSDDYIEDEMYEKLLIAITKENADISTCLSIDEYEGEEAGKLLKSDEYVVLDSQEALNDLMINNDYLRHATWNKLYKRELFDSIKFPVGRIYEDAAIMYRLLDNIKSIVCVNSELHHYIQRKDSIIHATYKRKSVDDRFHNGLEAADYFKNKPDMLATVYCWNAGKFRDLWEEAYRNKDIKMSNEIFDAYKQIPIMMVVRHVNIKQRIKMAVFRMNPKIYKALNSLNHKRKRYGL